MKSGKYTSIIVFLALLCFNGSRAQDLSFARKQIDTLCSFYFGGRGYVDSGAFRASHYLASFFTAYHLKSFVLADNYFQKLNMPVNTFPGKLSFSIDGKLLKPGKDYLADPSSAGISEHGLALVRADKNFFENFKNEREHLRAEKFALVIDADEIQAYKGLALARKINYLRPALVIELRSGKLIWSVSRQKLRKGYIWLQKEMLPADAKSVNIEIEAKFYRHYPLRNIIGYVEGTKYPDSFLVLSAHYDHLGKMGRETFFPGANDNASGTALLLNMMDYYSHPENKPRYSICFMLFTGEEAGLVGSRHYTDHPVFPLDRIKFLINLDLMSNGQDGMMVVNGSIFPEYFEKLCSINSGNHFLKEIKRRGKAANSDHYYFSEHDVKAFFFYLLGNYPYYHDIYDTPDKPSYAGYNGAFRLITAFLKSF